ncbi:unnamed protein product, partial [marine sediment metagenome]
NDSLHKEYTYEPWQKILRWSGIFHDNHQIDELAKKLNKLVRPIQNSQLEEFRCIENIKTDFGNISIRPILFSPERPNNNNADKFINWTELNNFLWLCLCPNEQRQMCGTRYDFTAWGKGLNEIVKAYKNRQKSQTKFKNIDGLYFDIENLRKAAANSGS